MSQIYKNLASGPMPPFIVETLTGNDLTPVSPVANNINVLGSTVANATNAIPLYVKNTSAGTETWQIQVGAASASSNINNAGLASFSNSQFSVDANGYVTLLGTAAIEGVTVDAHTAPGTSPVLPNSSGDITVTGGQIAASSTVNVIQTNSLAANTYTIQIQRSQAVASSTIGDNGVSHFNSAQFSVDANGFVSANGSGLGETITGNDGTILTPSSGNWNILGRSGSKTSGSGNTLTIKSPFYSDQASSTTVTLNSGSSVTAAITLTLPASAGLADGDLVEFYCTTAGALVIQSVGTQKIRLGSLISSAAGTATSTNIGDSVSLRFRAADGFWYATSIIGTWIMA